MLKLIICFFLNLAFTLSMDTAQTSENKSPSQMANPADQREKQNSKDIVSPTYELISGLRSGLELPEITDAWILEVETRGGLTGTVKSHILLTSEGDVTLDNTDGHLRIKLSDGFPEMNDLIKQVRSSEWSALHSRLPNVSLCHDCYRIKIELYRRESDGTKSGYRAYWDVTTEALLVKEVARIYALSLQIKQRALQTYSTGAEKLNRAK